MGSVARYVDVNYLTSITHYKWWVRPRRNKSPQAPWGYTLEPVDKASFIPDPLKLDLLERAKDFIGKGQSARVTAEWLSKEAGQKLSHTGLNSRMKADAILFEEMDYDSIDKFYSVVETDQLAVSRSHLNSTYGLTRNSHLKDIPVEERGIEKQKLKLQQAKRLYTLQKNKLIQKVDEAENKNITVTLPEDIQKELDAREEEEIQKEFEDREVIFRPNKGPQEYFLAAAEDEVFYGGARGGGKTYSLIMDPLRYCGNKNFRALFIRRTMPELRDIIYLSTQIYPKVYKGAKFHKQSNTWNFPSGSRIEFGYAETEMDAERYRGQSYTWAGIDELPLYPDSGVYDLIKSSVRTTDPTLKTYMRSTGNPGNVGSAWVKKKFIDPAPSNTRFHEHTTFYDHVKGEMRTTSRSLKYIPATLFDNPYLTRDENYISALASLPEIKRKQMLEGNWDVIEEGAFPEFDREVHVVKPFAVPGNWQKFRAADWGYSSPFSCLWMAVDWDGNVYVYREWYDQGVIADEWATRIAEIEIEAKEFMDYGVIDGSTDSSRGDTGLTIYETINKVLRDKGVKFFKKADRSPGSRAAGKQAVHQRLALKPSGLADEDGKDILKPTLFIFDSCTDLIRTLPQLPVDPLDPEKVAKKNQEDHSYDALQYGLRSRPKSSKNAYMGFKTVSTYRPVDTTFGY